MMGGAATATGQYMPTPRGIGVATGMMGGAATATGMGGAEDTYRRFAGALRNAGTTERGPTICGVRLDPLGPPFL
jgi:hypothetical protein